jgi:hypothetical protein
VSASGRPENVLALPRRNRAGGIRSSRIGVVQAAVARLDELAFALRQLSPHVSWSARQCMIASTPLRMLLTIARRKVNDLISSSLSDDQDADRWVLEFNDACLETDRRLHEIEVCLHTLQCTELSLAERGQGIEIFASSKSELLTVLGEMSRLIGQWPTAGMKRCPGPVDARRELNSDLGAIGQRLQTMIATYEEKPSALDGDILEIKNHESGITAAIAETYKIMNNRVYSEVSPLRADDDLWEASKDQKGEFIHFYRSALMALETYQKVLKAYRMLDGEHGPRLHRGGLERMQQDAHTQVKERTRCIEAISDFEAKFAAMLSVLCPNERN